MLARDRLTLCFIPGVEYAHVACTYHACTMYCSLAHASFVAVLCTVLLVLVAMLARSMTCASVHALGVCGAQKSIVHRTFQDSCSVCVCVCAGVQPSPLSSPTETIPTLYRPHTVWSPTHNRADRPRLGYRDSHRGWQGEAVCMGIHTCMATCTSLVPDVAMIYSGALVIR